MRTRGISWLTALAVGAVGMTATSSASAQPSPCPKKPPNVIAKTKSNYVYRVGKVLYGCDALGVADYAVKKLGPWAPGSKAKLSSKVVIWTVRATRPDGTREDRIWVADPAAGAVLKGVSPFPAPKAPAATGGAPAAAPVTAADGDARVAKMIATYDVAAWVTQAGSVVGVDYFSANAQSVVGAGTPGVVGPVGEPGLIASLPLVGRRLLVGRWGADAVPQLSSTVAFNQFDGEADGCSAVSEYQLVVKPVAGQPEVGASWSHNVRFDLPECE